MQIPWSGYGNSTTQQLAIYSTVADFTPIALYANATTSGIIRQRFLNSDGTKYFYIGANFDAASTPTGIGVHLSIASDTANCMTFLRTGQNAMTGRGDVANPDLVWTTDLTTGLYQPAGSQIGVAIAGANVGTITATAWAPKGDLNPGTDNNSAIRCKGTAIFFNTGSVAAQTAFICNNLTEGALSLSGGNTLASSNAAGVIFYGSTHATKANKTEWYNNGSLSLSLSSAGVLTIPNKFVYNVTATAAAQAMTLTNGPTATGGGDPDKWMTISDGTNDGVVPWWQI